MLFYYVLLPTSITKHDQTDLFNKFERIIIANTVIQINISVLITHTNNRQIRHIKNTIPFHTIKTITVMPENDRQDSTSHEFYLQRNSGLYLTT